MGGGQQNSAEQTAKGRQHRAGSAALCMDSAVQSTEHSSGGRVDRGCQTVTDAEEGCRSPRGFIRFGHGCCPMARAAIVAAWLSSTVVLKISGAANASRASF